MILNDRADISLLQVPLASQVNMSRDLRNTIHYMETGGSSGQGSLIENDFIQRILGECLLISNLPGKALRTLVYIARLAERFNMRSQSRAL